MAELTNLNATVKRHTTPGSLVILLCAGFVFGPKTLDYLIGEPWIESELTIVHASSGEKLVEDVVRTNAPIAGLRANVIENEAGDILCSTEHHNTWHGERKRIWHMSAFTACPAPTGVTYRVCSRFAVESGSGRKASYGPFCSAYMVGS